MARNSAFDNQPITFIGGTFEVDPVRLSAGERSRSLAGATVGDRLEIQAIKAGHSTLKQLRRVGLRPGQRVTVLNCAASGSVIVTCANRNVGLGAAIAQRVIVVPATAVSGQRPPTVLMQSPATLPAV